MALSYNAVNKRLEDRLNQNCRGVFTGKGWGFCSSLRWARTTSACSLCCLSVILCFIQESDVTISLSLLSLSVLLSLGDTGIACQERDGTTRESQVAEGLSAVPTTPKSSAVVRGRGVSRCACRSLGAVWRGMCTRSRWRIKTQYRAVLGRKASHHCARHSLDG